VEIKSLRFEGLHDSFAINGAVVGATPTPSTDPAASAN